MYNLLTAEDVTYSYQSQWQRWVPASGSWRRWWQTDDFYTVGARCSYNSNGALIVGYDDMWAFSNVQLYFGGLGGAYYAVEYATKDDWISGYHF